MTDVKKRLDFSPDYVNVAREETRGAAEVRAGHFHASSSLRHNQCASAVQQVRDQNGTFDLGNPPPEGRRRSTSVSAFIIRFSLVSSAATRGVLSPCSIRNRCRTTRDSFYAERDEGLPADSWRPGVHQQPDESAALGSEQRLVLLVRQHRETNQVLSYSGLKISKDLTDLKTWFCFCWTNTMKQTKVGPNLHDDSFISCVPGDTRPPL